MKILVFSFLLVSLNAIASHPLEGRWQGDGKPINFFEWQGRIVGSISGPTDYVFNYDPKSLRGSLVTYDSQYGCKLENGESKTSFLDPNRIAVIFNRINFNVSKTYVGSTTQISPVYCDYGMGPFICAWEDRPKAPSKVECQINFRQPIRVELTRI